MTGSRSAFTLTLLDYPDSARVHAGLGLAWSELDEPERARESWREACKLDPQAPGVPEGYCD